MKKIFINLFFLLIFFPHFVSSAEESKYTKEQLALYNIMDSCWDEEGFLKCHKTMKKLYNTFSSQKKDTSNWMYHEVRYWLADNYFRSSIKEDKEKGIKMWTDIFNDQHYEKDNWYKLASATALGWNHYIHTDVRDFNKAFKFTKYAADQDFYWAINNLGVLYDQGRAIKQNYKKAFDLYSKAADLGSNWSHGNIAVLYTFGLGVKKDYHRTIAHLKLARIEWAYDSDEFSELMVLFNKKRLPLNVKEYMSWIEDMIIKNQIVDDFQNLAWISDIDDSVEDPLLTEYKWHYITTKLSKNSELIERSFQEIDYLEEIMLTKEEIILAKKLGESWIEKNWISKNLN